MMPRLGPPYPGDCGTAGQVVIKREGTFVGSRGPCDKRTPSVPKAPAITLTTVFEPTAAAGLAHTAMVYSRGMSERRVRCGAKLLCSSMRHWVGRWAYACRRRRASQ